MSVGSGLLKYPMGVKSRTGYEMGVGLLRYLISVGYVLLRYPMGVGSVLDRTFNVSFLIK